MAIDSQTEVLALKVFVVIETQTSKGRWFQAHASRKPLECLTLIGLVILSWTVIGYIFHMWKTLYANLIRPIAFFTGENIAHIEFYLQGLLPKILAIYTIKYNTIQYNKIQYKYNTIQCNAIQYNLLSLLWKYT